MPRQCTEVVSHSKIKVEENGKKAVFKNDNRTQFSVTHIDGCLIKDGLRSDYLVTSEANEVSVLIELKGVDVPHACDQLKAMVSHEKITPLLKKNFGCLVVCRRYPQFDSIVMRSKQEFARKYKAGFHVIPKSETFDITRVADIDGPY